MNYDVSVVLPVFNRADLVVIAIRSALDQTVPPREIIVVDDGSTDGSAEAAEAIGSPLVRVLRKRANEGVAAARNDGVGLAQGGLIAFLDSDDRWLPSKLELQVAARREMSDPCLIMSGFRTFGKERRSRALVPACLSAEDQFESLIALAGGPVTASIFMLDTDLARANGFDGSITPLEDLELAIRLAWNGTPIVGPQVPLVDKLSDTSRSRLFTPRNSLSGRINLLEKYADHLKLRPNARARQRAALARALLKSNEPTGAVNREIDRSIDAQKSVLLMVARRLPKSGLGKPFALLALREATRF